jgi:hypothetical protein
MKNKKIGSTGMLIPCILTVTELHNEPLIQKAKTFKNSGALKQNGAYAYLKIADAFIHELYELLDDAVPAQKPDYFHPLNAIGAHITFTYPEENIVLHSNDIDTQHTFTIKNFCRAALGQKEYFVLTVSSPSLALLRTKHGLQEKLVYKDASIDFHITIATWNINKSRLSI